MVETESAQSIETPYSWVVAAASLVIASLSFGAVTSIPILMNPIIHDLGWTRSTIGMAHALAMVAAGVAGYWLGRIADRRSFALLSITGGVAIGVGLWLTSTACSPWGFYLPYAFLVGGVGQGAFFGPITATVSHWFDRNQGLAMALVMCGQSVGGLTVPVFLRVAADEWGWRGAMAGYGALSALAIVLCSLVFTRPAAARERRAEPVQSGGLLDGKEHRRTFACMIVPLMLCNSGSFILIAHMVALGESEGLTPLHSSVLLSITLGMTIVSRLLCGALLDVDRPRVVLYVSKLLLPVGGLTILLADGEFSKMLFGAAILGLGYGGVFPMYTSLARSVFPAAASGAWISAMFMFAFFAAAVGSWLGGFLYDISGGYSLALHASILLTVQSLLAAPVLLKTPLTAYVEHRKTVTLRNRRLGLI